MSGGATGTAHTILAGCRSRNPWRAAIMVAPVASPSSMTMTIRPAGSMGGRSGVYWARRIRIVSSWRRFSSSTYVASAPAAAAWGAR